MWGEDMLTEERYNRILKCLNEEKTVSVARLVEELNVSESTIRRDLNYLAGMNRIIKVHGGATAISENYDFGERNVETKQKLFSEEKEKIARYAAGLIRENDFIFIDAGTTTEKLIDFIQEPTATFVTNGFIHAKKLAYRGFKVYLLGGEIKAATEAVVGSECIEQLRKYNFHKCYLGTNGISMTKGFTTPDPDEAGVKRAAAEHSYIPFILADHSKFNQTAPVTFYAADKACIITDRVPDKDQAFLKICTIKEVEK